MKKRLLLLVFLGVAIFSAQAQIFVDANVVGGSNDGSSWVNAYSSLQDAIADACGGGGTEIWVAEGTYKPSAGIEFDGVAGISTREYTFQLCEGIEVYGGFAGGETMLSQRNVAMNPTILSGDVDNNNTFDNGNAYHVVYTTNLTSATVLDGFTIQEGNANGPAIVGGGIYNNGAGGGNFANPTIRNCIIKNNFSSFGGGGVTNYGIQSGQSNPIFINCAFLGNIGFRGGAMGNFGNFGGESNPTLINCSISGNFSSSGGGINNNADGGTSNPQIINTIIWNNADANGIGTADANVFNDQGSGTIAVTFENSLVQGFNPGGTNKNGIANQAEANYPQFVTPADPTTTPNMVGNLNLRYCSPLIDMGDNSAISEPKDLASEVRVFNAIIDLGAYEYQGPLLEVGLDNNGPICENEQGQLTFTSNLGTFPFTLTINNTSYPNVTSGSPFDVATVVGDNAFTLTAFEGADACPVMDLDIETTLQVDPLPVVGALTQQTICSTKELPLADSNPSVMYDGNNADLTYAWTIKEDPGANGTLTGTDSSNPNAGTYTPSADAIERGFVTLVLTVDNPNDTCEAVSAEVVITILKVDCGTFPWRGNE